MVCCGSIVLKRRQNLSIEKAKNAPGEIVDLAPTDLESYAFRLMMKKVASKTKKPFYICGDGDMTVEIHQLSTSYQAVIWHLLLLRFKNHIIWTISYGPYDMILKISNFSFFPTSRFFQLHFSTTRMLNHLFTCINGYNCVCTRLILTSKI